jgi:hypothetical protein
MVPLVPRVQHAVPNGQVTEARTPIPVVVELTWYDGHRSRENGVAIAWTSAEVLVEWTTPWDTLHAVWVRAEAVRRRQP